MSEPARRSAGRRPLAAALPRLAARPDDATWAEPNHGALACPRADDPDRRRSRPEGDGDRQPRRPTASPTAAASPAPTTPSSAPRLVAEGPDLLDLGGESSRPGSEPVSLEEELHRVIPVVEALSDGLAVPISIDTTKAEVARRALDAGAAIINDITAMAGDPDMGRVAAESGAGVVLMHMQGVPRTMQENPRYADVVRDIYDFLARRVEWAESIGIPRDRIAIDPGIGFGKTIEHNLEILRNLRRFDTLGCAVVIGTSRKGFLGTITGRACPSVQPPRSSRRWRRARGRAGREGPRRRTDGRCDQGLGGGAGLGETS